MPRLGELEYEVTDEEGVLQSFVTNIPDKQFEMTLKGNVYHIDTRHFNVDAENLEEEACKVGGTMSYYGDLFAEAQAYLAECEEARKQIYSQMYLQVYEDTKEKKLTVAQAESIAMRAPSYREAMSKEIHAKRLAAQASVYWRVAQKKAEMINMLGYRQSAEIKKGY
jgi:hypothetical protein